MLKETTVKAFNENFTDIIAHDWAVLTVTDQNKVNGMTVSWGQMGHLWNKDVITVYVRPQRHTYPLINKEGVFSLSFFEKEEKKKLSYLGTKSGRDEDKLKTCDYDCDSLETIPYIKQARIVFLCRILYTQDLQENCFTDLECMNKNYPGKDFHRAYIAEIVKVMVKD